MHIYSNNYLPDSSPGKRHGDRENCDRAVSPVVGVMLMLVVVIIIAAVVSGFSGGLINGHANKAPSLAMNLEIANSGDWTNSYFKGEVTSTSDPIPTKNLEIVTKWTKYFPNGTTLNGGATTTPGIVNFNVIYDTHGGMGYDLWRLTVPLGYGPGVGNNQSQFTSGSGNYFWNIDGGGGEYAVVSGAIGNTSWWGNYYLQSGTMFLARPFGGRVSSQAYVATGLSTPSINQFVNGYGVTQRFQYNYSSPSAYYSSGNCVLTMEGHASTTTSCSNGWQFPYPTSPDQEPSAWVPYVQYLPAGYDPRTYSVDMMQGVLGNHWEILRPGDTVNVKIIYIPTGSTIWQKDVSVTGTMY